MATTHIYGKTILQNFSSQEEKSMTLKHGIKHDKGLGLIIVYSNDGFGLTMTSFTVRLNLVSYAFEFMKKCLYHTKPLNHV